MREPIRPLGDTAPAYDPTRDPSRRSARGARLAGDRLVVTIGLSGVIVVDTPEAVLVVSAEHAQDVREVAQRLSTGRPAAAQEEGKP